MIFHHVKKSLKNKSKWQDLQDQDCDTILHSLIDEQCVCLCSNCHSIIHSNYVSNFRSIFKNILSNQEILNLKAKLRDLTYKIKKMISSFHFNLDIVNFDSPLKNDIPTEEIWKIKMLEVYNLLKL